jgi:bla regulator protein BlaR1
MEVLNFVFANPLMVALSRTLLHLSWQSVLLALILYLALKVISIKKSNLRYLVASFTLLANLGAAILSFFWLYQPHNSVPSATLLISGDLEQSISAVQTLEWEWIYPFISIAWFIGVLFFTAQLIYEMLRVYRVPKHAVITTNEQVLEMFERLKVELKANRFTRLLISHIIDVPMVMGWLRPVVILPASMLTCLSCAQLESLIAHELAHVRRYDYLINLLQTSIEVLLFFHPCVKWISRQVRVEREYCCDDVAIDCCGNAKTYLLALTNAEVLRGDNVHNLAMAATGGNLQQRVVRVVAKDDCSPQPTDGWLYMFLSVGLLLCLVFFLLSAPQAFEQRLAYIMQDKELLNGESAPARGDIKDVQAYLENDIIDLNISEPVKTSNEPVLVEQNQQFDLADSQKHAITKLSVEIDNNAERQVLSEDLKEATNAPQTAKNLAVQIATAVKVAPLDRLIVTSRPKLDVDKDSGTTEVLALSPALIQEPTELVATNNTVRSAQEKQTSSSQVSYQPNDMKGMWKHDYSDYHSQFASMSDVEQATEQTVRTSPRVVNKKIPRYPRSAYRRSLEVDVEVSFVVNKDGCIEDLYFYDEVQDPFKRSVERALSEWRFIPGTVNGQVAEMSMKKVFSFSNPDSQLILLTGSRIVQVI